MEAFEMSAKIKVAICAAVSLGLLQGCCRDCRGLSAKAGARRIANNTILHIGHSANLVKIKGRVLVFDYPYGSEAMAQQLYRFDPNVLTDENVYVFASHGHGDHFNTQIYTWKDRIRRIKFILPSDIMRHPDDAVMVEPGRELKLDDMVVRTYPSSDKGVAYSVYVAGKHIYFAGDNGFWNWEGKKSEQDYIRETLSTIDRNVPMDIAFQVCDPRAASVGEGGAGIFAVTFNPKLLVPLHTQGNYEFFKTEAILLKQRGFKNRFWAIKGLGDTTTF